MKEKLRYLRILLYSCTILLLMACAIPTMIQKLSDGTSTLQNEPSGSSETGSRLLPDPSVGLSNLVSYHVSFQQDITGTLDGKPYERYTHLDLTRLNGSDPYVFTNDVNGSDIQGFHLRLMASDVAYYRWMQSNPECQGSISAPSNGEVIEPASLLLPILNATRVGAETINQVPSIHFQFDQDDLPITKDTSPVSGDVWIAEQGGYVVRYTLISSGPDKLTGEGLEVAQKWTYELDQVNTLQGIDLPSGCLPVPADLPVPEDAQNVEQISGRMSYATAFDRRKLLDLYYRELPALDWVPHNESPSGDISLPYLTYFDQADQRLTLYINEDEQGGLDVDLLITIPGMVPQEALTVTPSGNPAPATTIDPEESGLPNDIPLYPGATDLVNTGELVMFKTSDAPADIAIYYRQQMITNGWDLIDETNTSDIIMQTWTKSDTITTVTVVAQDAKTSVVIALPK